MSEFRQRVARRFDDAAQSYDAHSAVQRLAAQQLAGRIVTAALPPRPRVLEIGCGTGHLTTLLADRLPGAAILATDIAPAMVDACRQRLQHHPRLDFAVMDACHPAGADFYDMICGNLVAQWFEDLPGALAGLAHCLAPGGLLALSLLGPESFREWRQAHAALGLKSGTLAFRSAETYRAAFPPGGKLVMNSALHIDPAESGMAFLRSLRAIGADTPVPGHAPLSAANLRRALHALGPAPAITYELIYACWRKEGNGRKKSDHSQA